MNAVSAETRWYGVTGAPAETEFTLTHALLPSGNAYTLVLAMGIRYGARNDEGLIVPVKGAGCAQVMLRVDGGGSSFLMPLQHACLY